MSYKKNDIGKLRFDLIPPEGIEALAHAYTVGVKEGHSERAWEEGGSWMRLFAALMRHAWKWARGEDLDSKSGIHHMASVAFYAMALITYSARGVKGDDRRSEVKYEQLKEHEEHDLPFDGEYKHIEIPFLTCFR